MNYEKELKNLQDSNFWKPDAKTYKVKFLGEFGEPRLQKFEDGNEVTKVDVSIEVGGEVFDWSVTKNNAKNSLYGQIVIFASQKNALKDRTITLIVTGQSKGRKYTVVEAHPEDNEE